ncbi:hypothetical protein SAMN05216319_2178 [Duganella sp. CF402]|uniref:hypothetical protein n=1 Tax=unclassified Duganella TaxID=2636909 RepID=UPI0008C98F05|nr:MULTISPECIES: hypothetical protein [unclassified Duganella]RZT09393.1 hypothetical protein EV582_1443 [Duganella sp. BK701]SEL59073.1 hypothetical protein SAMN05216319_2178 [Duganella sp. CF402]
MEKTKPDLLAASGARRPVGGKRILAQLEHGTRPAAQAARAAGWTIDGWTIGLFALLLLMCSVAWLMHDKTITPKTFRRDYSSGTSPSMPRHVTARASAQEQPAAIVNEAAPMSSPDEEQAAVPAPSAAGATSAAARFDHTAAAMPRTAASPAKATASATPAARSAATAAPAAATAASVQAGDTDVTLLTALMAHAGKPAAVTPERPRDVVERQDGDSTAQLLARCKQLGLIEGMLCRSRICSGRWEAEAACRAPSR